MDLKATNEILRHVWLEPKQAARMELPNPLTAKLRNEPYEEIDLDWWEPRYDQPWRRQLARDRQAFGGAYVAALRPPLEPKRERREWKEQLEGELEGKRADIRELEKELAELRDDA